MSEIRTRKRPLAVLAATAGAVLTLLVAGSAPGDIGNPVVTLGPTTVLNDVASVSGTVAGIDPSTAALSINGQPVGINAAGRFSGVVNLNGRSELVLSVSDPLTGRTNTIDIPLTTNIVGPGGVISPGVLSGIEQAAVSLLRPAGGFVGIGDKPITISGIVGNRDQLAGLTINGIDAMSLLKPDGSFAVPIPGSSKEVAVVVTDKQGVSVSTGERVTQRDATSVSATEALGVRIVSIRYYAKGVRKTKRLRMIVTVKDRRGLLIHGAVVSVRGAKAGRIAGRAKAKRSDAKGRAGFVLRLRPRAFGKRLVVVVGAKTPTAKASKRSSLALPRLAPRKSVSSRR